MEARFGTWLVAIVLVGIAGLLTKATLAAKDLFIAHTFGLSDAVDAFLIAYAVPAFALSVIGGSIQIVLIPAMMRIRHTEGTEREKQFFSSTLVLLIVLTFIVSALLWLLGADILRWLAPGFSAQKSAFALELFNRLIPLVTLGMINMCWGAILNSHNRFYYTALAPIATPLITIALLGALATDLSTMAVVYGILVGTILELGILAKRLAVAGYPLMPRWYGWDGQTHRASRQYYPVLLSALFMAALELSNQFFLTRTGPGAISAYGFATKITMVTVGLATAALGTVMLSRFAALVSGSDWRALRMVIRRYYFGILAITIPLTALIVLFSTVIVRALFQHGAFTAGDTEMVTTIQQFHALQIPFSVANILLARVYASLEANSRLAGIAAFMLICNVCLCLALAPHLGAAGIALANSITYAAAFLLMSNGVIWSWPHQDPKHVARRRW